MAGRLSADNIDTSQYSQDRKRQFDDTHNAAPSHASVYTAPGGLGTCAMTVPALLAMMLASASDARLRQNSRGAHAVASAESMLAVAKAFCDRVLKDIVLPTSHCVKVVNGYVDNAALQASQEALKILARSRIAG